MSNLVQNLIHEGLAADPQAPAVKQSDGESLSFAELDVLSNQIARTLKSHGVSRNDRVALCLNKGVKYVASILGVLKADAIYVPIYEKSPLDRALHVFLDCSPTACITDQGHLPLVSQITNGLPAKLRILLLGEDDSPIVAANEQTILSELPDQLPYRNADTDIAYLLYTSGSTGKPKGVMVRHDNVLDYAEWGKSFFSLSTSDRVFSTAPFYFDMSIFDIFCSIASGSTLCLATENEQIFPGLLTTLIENYGITVWKGVSSLLSFLSKTDAIDSKSFAALRAVIFAGEPLPSKHLAHWMSTYPNIHFYNGYGPTETTGISICHSFQNQVSPDSSIPLGRPCTNHEVIILRSSGLERCAAGESGEICIQGAGVSAGYWNDVDKTNNRFIDINGYGAEPTRTFRTGDSGYIDDDGLVWMNGRLDDQVKVRGHRIELGDVCNAILTQPEILDAVVMLLPDKRDDNVLVAFLESKSSVTGESVKQLLHSSLPDYMVPKLYYCLDRLPHTERGKVDKTTLHELHRSSLIAGAKPL